jgi:hypothetical protein
MSASEVQRLSKNPAVKQIVPDSEVAVGEAPLAMSTVAADTAPSFVPGQSRKCDTKQPQVEPEALTDIHELHQARRHARGHRRPRLHHGQQRR